VAETPRIITFMPIVPGAGAAPAGRPHRVVALALPRVILLDLAAPAHLFGHCGGRRYSFALAGPAAGPVATSTGFPVLAARGLGALRAADTIVVPGWDGERGGPRTAAAAAALAAAHRRGARVMSVCTGAFLLAQAGLLDGRRATTHWASTDELAARYPEITVDPAVLYVDEGSVLTSAGVAAGLDLCLHVIRRDHGARVAASVARRTVVAPHRDGGQAQFIARPLPEPGVASGSLAATREWALERIDRRLDVAALAAHACMSRRTFARRFVQETGTTPGQWVLEQRTRAAQALLEATDLPIEQVATRSGFGGPATLRLHFARRLSITPTAYRRRFRDPQAAECTAPSGSRASTWRTSAPV
jgi:transcriptional regulator GlxA family with amidase domain